MITWFKTIAILKHISVKENYFQSSLVRGGPRLSSVGIGTDAEKRMTASGNKGSGCLAMKFVSLP